MSLPRLILESLEPRIAPAVILAGPTSVGGQQYNSQGTPFHSASSVPTENGALTGFANDNYYLALKAGDTLKVYTTSGYVNFITVTAGTVDAFFVDSDTTNPGVPNLSELTGLSVSAGANLKVGYNINGDIIANLDGATGKINVASLISNKQNIASLNTGGFNVGGSIIAGGSISNVTVGNVTDIATGISSDTPYTFGGSSGVGTGTLTEFSASPSQGTGFLPAAKLAGASLSNISVNSASEIIAGGGGAGAVGGNISNVTIISDSNGIIVQGGAGGAGAGTVISGGGGGQVSNVVMFGPSVADTSNNSLIDIAGGDGGSALTGSTGAGGNGGLVNKIWVGYYYPNPANHSVIVPSQNWLNDDVTVHGGDGGAGVTAGNGAGVNNTTLLTATPLASANDIQVLGGDGGALFANGVKAGVGGTINTFNIKDYLDTASTAGSSTVLIEGGDASSTQNLTSTTCGGAAGGSVINPSSAIGALVGQSFDLVGGNGSSGTQTGGAGGGVSYIDFGSFADEFLQNLTVITGAGGASTTGNGGAGGNITGIFAPDTSLSSLTMSIGNGGQSGFSTFGAIGGKGGSINSVSIGADDALDANFAALTPTAGNGGDGFKGGGAGGSIQNFSFFIPSTNTTAQASLDATAGNGGAALGATGNGGAGGAITGVSYSAQVPDLITNNTPNTQFATLNAGNGGNGAGSGIAGAGGSITKSNAQTIDNVGFYAGIGGDAGSNGQIGVGGSIGSATAAQGVFAVSADGEVSYFAGSAGSSNGSAAVKTGAAGGSIINAVASANGDITFTAGSGSDGGNGGNISQIAFYGSPNIFTPNNNTAIPDGNTSVIAGDGGDAISATTVAGKGGSVTNAAGYTGYYYNNDGRVNSATFQAGNGGSGGSVGGAGGSFTGLTIYGGEVSFGIEAGNGGSGTNTGGIGGNVSNIAVQSTASSSAAGGSSGSSTSTPNVTIYDVVAGNGGSTTLSAKGAAGGNVTNVNVAGDIGVLNSVKYGYATDGSAMGGIFAGVGGAGKTGSALNGNVSTITAQAISAIVAGTGASPLLVNNVNGIYLSGDTAPTATSTGAFNNFPTATATNTVANVVGGKYGDPTLPNAVDFQTSNDGSLTPSGAGSIAWTLGGTDPIDGLVAALTLTANRNFTPLAFLTTDTSQSTGYGIYLPPVPVVS